MSISSSIVKELWWLLDQAMVALNKPIKDYDEKVRNGTIDQVKMDREKIAGEALGLAKAIKVVNGDSIDTIRAEAIDRYLNRRTR